MSNSMVLLQAQAAPTELTGLNAKPASPGADRSTDVYALWKAIFERSHPRMATPIAVAAIRSADIRVAAPAEGAALQTSARAHLQPEASTPSGACAESVNVCVSGAVVAIAVRNAALAEQEALRSAFEVARELTGERAGLRRLTLNGRTVYRQSEIAARPCPGSAWTFAC